MKNLTIRPYDFGKDPERIVKTLYTDFNSEAGIAQVRNDDHQLSCQPEDAIRLVAATEQEDLVSSVVAIRDHPTSFILYSLVTRSDYRGTGITARILDACIDWIRQHDGQLIQTSTDYSNIAAQRFLEKYGFHRYDGQSMVEYTYPL